MADRRTFVIVGGGLTGAKAAETLRAEGFAGRVILVAAERDLPYERPPLSKSYLAGASAFADAQVHDEAFYAEHDVELLAGTAASELDVGARRLALADGRTLAYDRLLIATGAVPRRPPVPGVALEGVHVLRTVADADALRAVIGPGLRLAIVGAGWIGCEVAATARTLGADVTLLAAGAPLERVLGAPLGGFFAELHRSHGVELVAGAAVTAIEPGLRVRLADGGVHECDAVLLGVGVTPATTLGESAGLAVADGIACDSRLRTSAADVFAAGDVASVLNARYGRRIRVEHWANAGDQGAAAARAMLGAEAPYATVPFFFSDQYDAGLEYYGRHDASDRVVIRGALGSRPFQAFWLAADGSVTAGMHVDDWDATEAIKRLVERGAPVDAARLADPAVPLDDVS